MFKKKTNPLTTSWLRPQLVVSGRTTRCCWSSCVSTLQETEFHTCINIWNLISDLTKTATCSDTNELLFTAAVEEVQSPLRAVTSTPEKSHFKVRAQRTGASDLLTLVIINSVSGLTAAAASYQRQGWRRRNSRRRNPVNTSTKREWWLPTGQPPRIQNLRKNSH